MWTSEKVFRRDMLCPYTGSPFAPAHDSLRYRDSVCLYPQQSVPELAIGLNRRFGAAGADPGLAIYLYSNHLTVTI